MSTDRWDVRGAVVSTAPTRPYVINGGANPRATPVLVAGGGVTPTAGLRLGLSMAHGDHATSEELTTSAFGDSRTSTMLALEGEYAFGYTRIAGELLHNRLQSSRGCGDRIRVVPAGHANPDAPHRSSRRARKARRRRRCGRKSLLADEPCFKPAK